MFNYTTTNYHTTNQPTYLLTEEQIDSSRKVAELQQAASRNFDNRRSASLTIDDLTLANCAELCLAMYFGVPPQTGINKFYPDRTPLPDLVYRKAIFDVKSNRGYPNMLIEPARLKSSWVYVMATGNIITRSIVSLCGYIKGSEVSANATLTTLGNDKRPPVYAVHISKITPFTGCGNW